MGKKYKDFDAMFSEMKSETIPFKVFGKTYQINKEIPAFVVLEMARHENDAELSTKFLFRAGEAIFGKETLDELCKQKGFSAEKLGMMIKWAFEAINGKDEPEIEEITEDDTGAKPEKN